MSLSPRVPRSCFWIVLLPLCLAMSANAADETVSAKKYSAREFFETTSIAGASFSADESRVLMSSDADGVFNAYSQPFAGR